MMVAISCRVRGGAPVGLTGDVVVRAREAVRLADDERLKMSLFRLRFFGVCDRIVSCGVGPSGCVDDRELGCTTMAVAGPGTADPRAG